MAVVKIVSSLIAGGILTATSLAIVDDVVGPASEIVAASSISTVVRSAQPGFLLGYETWPEALANAAASVSQGGDALTVTGTTVRWAHEEACFEASVPDVWAAVVVTSCDS